MQLLGSTIANCNSDCTVADSANGNCDSSNINTRASDSTGLIGNDCA